MSEVTPEQPVPEGLPELKEDPKAVAVREARERLAEVTEKYQSALAEMVEAEEALDKAIENLHRKPDE